jgi:hypothetical protein
MILTSDIHVSDFLKIQQVTYKKHNESILKFQSFKSVKRSNRFFRLIGKTYTECGQNAGFVNIKPGGSYCHVSRVFVTNKMGFGFDDHSDEY